MPGALAVVTAKVFPTGKALKDVCQKSIKKVTEICALCVLVNCKSFLF